MNTIIRKRELSQKLGVSECSIWRWVRAGHFPKPIKLGPNAIGWETSAIERWLQTQRDVSDQQPE